MPSIVSTVESSIEKRQASTPFSEAGDLINELLESGAYVGDVYSLSYETALIQIHDHYRAAVGGIPRSFFLGRHSR